MKENYPFNTISTCVKRALIILLFSLSILTAKTQDIFSYQSSLDFANYLYRSYEYSLAANEYQRLFYIDQSDSLINYRLIHCYYSLKDWQKVGLTGNKIGKNLLYKHKPAGLLVMKSNLLSGKTLEGLSNIESLNLSEPAKSYYQLSAWLLAGNWEKAITIKNQNPVVLNSQMYADVFSSLENTKFKSPWKAVTLSVVVPGLGKVYSGYWKDGLLSLVMVGVSAWQASSGFNRQGVQSYYGWINAGLATGFYLGNIYGTIKSVHKKNKQLNHELYHKVEHSFTSNLEY